MCGGGETGVKKKVYVDPARNMLSVLTIPESHCIVDFWIVCLWVCLFFGWFFFMPLVVISHLSWKCYLCHRNIDLSW